MFIDKVKITVKAGNGGNGAVAFHREKYVAAGGPDGGDGGKGGNIVLRVNDNLSTLMDFRYKRKYAAAPGQDGQGARCSGKRGEDLVIQVPRGTVVRDAATNEIIKDMSDDADFILCKGGRGGWGNKHFATPTRQVPRFAKAGLPGEELIAEPHQLFSYFIQIEFAVIAQMDAMFFEHAKRQKKVHTSPYTGDDGNFLPLKKCLDHLKPLPDQ